MKTNYTEQCHGNSCRQNETSSISAATRERKKTSCWFEQSPDFLRIKSLHIFLFGAAVYQTAVTPTLPFNGPGVMCAALCGNCCSSLSNISENVRNSIVCRHWETCNLRVTWPAGSHRRCPAERAGCHGRNEARYTPRLCVCVWRGGQMCSFYNELTSFVLLIIICHLWEHNKGYNHGYSARAQRKGRMRAKPRMRQTFSPSAQTVIYHIYPDSALTYILLHI